MPLLEVMDKTRHGKVTGGVRISAIASISTAMPAGRGICARGNSRRSSRLAQNLTNEVRSRIENTGLLLKAPCAPHKTGDADHSNDPIRLPSQA